MFPADFLHKYIHTQINPVSINCKFQNKCIETKNLIFQL